MNSAKEWKIAPDPAEQWFDPKKGDQLIEREYAIAEQPDSARGDDGGGAKTIADMPAGLSKMQQAAWRKQNGL